MRHLVVVILYGWLSGMQEHMLLHTSRRKHVEKRNILRKILHQFGFIYKNTEEAEGLVLQ